MEERLHRAGAFGVDLVQSVHGLVHLHTQFDFPPHAVEVNHLSRADLGGEIRQEEAIALGRVDPNKAEMQRMLGVPHLDVSINGPTIEGEDVAVQEGVEVGPGEEFLGDLSAGNGVHGILLQSRS
jgi:hypothetical protein